MWSVQQITPFQLLKNWIKLCRSFFCTISSLKKRVKKLCFCMCPLVKRRMLSFLTGGQIIK